MKPIAVFYHCLFVVGDPPELLPNAFNVVCEQMIQLNTSGLLDTAAEFHVGINGGHESEEYVRDFLPKAQVTYHGLQSRAENMTLVMIENWVKTHPGWYVLYAHCKGATHVHGSDYEKFTARWRRCMMKHCVNNWKKAVAALDAGCEAAGCHWLSGQGIDQSQHYFAGNIWWATSDFLATLPSIYERARIKESGIASIESRYEAEVWIGNGRMPKVKDLELSHGLTQCP